MNYKLKRNETDEQIAVAKYLNLKHLLFCHVPNEGKRSKFTAAQEKEMGLKKGVPDLLIFEPRGKYVGLAIEMKVKGGTVSDDQREWLASLYKKGWCALACWGADDAISIINHYLELKEIYKDG